jgi:F0F1-type ATP synthase membrane subunit c/vacuolar-type H+-ATPase subunit K
MKRALLTIPAFLTIVAMMLAILFALVRVSLAVGNITSDAIRAAARCGELVLGVILLLGGTFVATRKAVWLFQSTDTTNRAANPS